MASVQTKTKSTPKKRIALALAFIIIGAWLILLVNFQLRLNRPALAQAVVEIAGQEVQADVAATPEERYRGLSGHEPLCDDCGMLFIFPDRAERTFVMRGMGFPLDIIFIDGGRISHIAASLPILKSGEGERPYGSEGPADRVLEVVAGYAAAHSWTIGAEVKINIYED